MKKHYLFTLLSMLFIITGNAQAYNPFVQNIQFQTPPTASGYLCGSVQNVSFTQGISTQPDATQWQTSPLTVVICLTGFVFEGNAASNISGTYASKFNWAYDNFAPNCIVGVQNQTLPGIGSGTPNPLASGTIHVSVKVPINSPLNMALAVNVNLQIPSYMTSSNTPSDDNESVQAVAYCSCYDFITNGGIINGNQTFFNSGNPLAFGSTSSASGGTGGIIEYQWEESSMPNVWSDIAGATSVTYDAPNTTTSKNFRRKAKRSTCGTWVYSNIVGINITNAGLDKEINCTTANVVIGLPTLNGHTYSWNPISGLSSNNVAQPIASPAATTIYTATVTDPLGNVSTDLVIVNVSLNPPSLSTNASSNSICVNASTTLTANGAVDYTWIPGSLSGATVSVSPISTTTYTITGTGMNGCTNTTTKTITVNANPTVAINATLPTICQGQSTTLSGTGANIYTWDFGATYMPSITVTPSGTTTFAVIGTNTNTGCTNLSLRTITVNSSPNVTVVPLSATICNGASASLTANGASSYTWQPGSLNAATVSVSPSITTTYTVTGTNSLGCTKTATRLVTVTPCGNTLNLKAFIQGYYASANSMNPVLLNQGVAGAGANVCDSIKVELRNSTSPFALAASTKTTISTSGIAICNFPISGNYYVVIQHRNGLETWSAAPVAIGGNTSYDFTNNANKAYGNNMKQMETNVWAIYSGDLNADNNIDLLDASILELSIGNFEFGYFSTDLNGDGNVDLLDASLAEINISDFIFTLRP